MTRPRYRRSRPDYPKGVIGIYDNAGLPNESLDRYLVVYEPIQDIGAHADHGRQLPDALNGG